MVIDGTSVEQGQGVSSELLRSLDLARKKLRCSFSAMDGRDIAEDLRCKLDEMPQHHRSRYYKFRVEYMERKRNGLSDEKVGEGEVMLILPRHPDEGKLTIFEGVKIEKLPRSLMYLVLWLMDLNADTTATHSNSF